MSMQHFDTLPIPRKETGSKMTSYRVYKTTDEFVVVQAATALEALKNCGFEPVYKVQKDSLSSHRVLDPEASAKVLLENKEETQAADAPKSDAPPPAAAAETPPPAEG